MSALAVHREFLESGDERLIVLLPDGRLGIALAGADGQAELEVDPFDPIDTLRLARQVLAGNGRRITEPGALRKLSAAVLHFAQLAAQAGALAPQAEEGEGEA